MQQKALGNTGLYVSPLGLGTTKFGRNQGVKYPEAFEIPDDKQLIALLKCARDFNINVIDTAPSYGTSEERVGRLLKSDRKDWVIVTKVGEEFIHGQSFYDFSPSHMVMSVKRSLKQLQTDYLDVVLVHSDGNDVYNIEHHGVFDCLSDLKQQGLIRAFGMSTKTIEGGILTVEKADVVMATYHPKYTAEKPVIEKAFQLKKGVLLKKALASGHIQQFNGTDPVKTTLQFILREPGVSSIIVGTINPNHLTHNVECIG